MAEEGPGAPSVRAAQQARGPTAIAARAKERTASHLRARRARGLGRRAQRGASARAHTTARRRGRTWLSRGGRRGAVMLFCQSSKRLALPPFLSQLTFAGTISPSRSGRALRLSRLGGALSGKLESGGRTTRTHSVATWSLHGRRPSHYRPLSNGPAHHPSARSFSSASLASALSRFLCARRRVQSGLCRS